MYVEFAINTYFLRRSISLGQKLVSLGALRNSYFNVDIRCLVFPLLPFCRYPPLGPTLALDFLLQTKEGGVLPLETWYSLKSKILVYFNIYNQ